MKDRSHYGTLDEEAVMEVTPEQAAEWLNTRPPPPIMWSRGAANREKAQRYADAMAGGEWDVDRPVEPVAILTNYNCILGGHHRLTAVTLLGRPQPLRIRFYTKPNGWDTEYRIKEREAALADFNTVPRCPVCAWPGDRPEAIVAHVGCAHKEWMA